MPPPTPGLVAESTRAGAWLFRWRSYPPLLALAYVVASTALEPVPAGGAGARALWVAAGLVLGALGLAVRGWTVGLVPGGTSGRGAKAQRAETLNTRGVYSLVRHPLYLGSYFLWVGVPVLAGRPLAALVTTLLFWLHHERIMMAEERFLFEEHGAAFGAWAQRTPAFLPRLSGWIASPHPFSLRFALGRDYPAFYAFVASATAVELTRSAAAGEGWWISTAWLAWFVAGTTVYVALHALKRLTRVLEAPDGR
ncbi:MAG: isoprenylcysteine carboxylmethyltransferase family protein [Longimicrobiales bacterium]|nr:isoprenylcysteine carboxylmethyltransferase family protein [Longimicrobiales bacterium]